MVFCVYFLLRPSLTAAVSGWKKGSKLDVLRLAHPQVDQEGDGRQHRQDCREGTGQPVVPPGDGHISRHGQRDILVVVQNDGAGQLGDDRHPAEDGPGDDAVGHHGHRDFGKGL